MILEESRSSWLQTMCDFFRPVSRQLQMTVPRRQLLFPHMNWCTGRNGSLLRHCSPGLRPLAASAPARGCFPSSGARIWRPLCRGAREALLKSSAETSLLKLEDLEGETSAPGLGIQDSLCQPLPSPSPLPQGP